MRGKDLWSLVKAFSPIPLVRIPKNKTPLYERSNIIKSDADKEDVLSKSRIIRSEDSINTVVMRGTPYEMGFQHGCLLEKEIKSFYNSLFKKVLAFIKPEMLDKAFTSLHRYIPDEYRDEIKGIAHGANIPQELVSWMHAIPEISEFSGRSDYSELLFGQPNVGTSCSLVAAMNDATSDKELYCLRVLDWDAKILNAQKYPAILVYQPDKGNGSVNFSFAGFTGCITGMNDRGICFGEQGWRDSEGETLQGKPFPFLARDILTHSCTVDEAEALIKQAEPTCSYVYMIADAQNKDAALFFQNPDNVKRYNPGQLVDETYHQGDLRFPGIPAVAYSGMDYNLPKLLRRNENRLSLSALQSIAAVVSLPVNIQTVVMKPPEAWVAYSTGGCILGCYETRASIQPYHHFDLEDVLQ